MFLIVSLTFSTLLLKKKNILFLLALPN
jgi:hypothetical protein